MNSGILDNIDAMKYEGSVFYRKSSVPKPHNGFTTLGLLIDKTEDLGYDMSGAFPEYLREKEPERNLTNIVGAVSVDYEASYKVEWVYDGDPNTYRRVRGGEAEIDKNTGKQVETNIVVLMHTVSEILNRDYITVNTTGEGEAEFYQNGTMVSGIWKNIADNLKFYDINGQEMKFVPGKMWIEVLATSD